MYGIYANMWGILMVNVTICGIHGSYGLWSVLIHVPRDDSTCGKLGASPSLTAIVGSSAWSSESSAIDLMDFEQEAYDINNTYIYTMHTYIYIYTYVCMIYSWMGERRPTFLPDNYHPGYTKAPRHWPGWPGWILSIETGILTHLRVSIDVGPQSR